MSRRTVDRAFRFAWVALAALVVSAASPGAVARHVPTDAPAYLLGGHSDYAGDADRDNVADVLRIDVPLRVATAGTYWLTGTLTADSTGKSSRELNVTAKLAVGNQTVRFELPGGYLYNQASDTTYLLAVTLRKAGTNVVLDTFDYRTSAYDSRDFEPAAMTVTRAPTIHFNDTDADGLPDELRISTLLVAREKGSYSLTACLTEARTGRVLPCLANHTFEAAEGAHAIDFPIPNATTGASYAGAYALTMHAWANGTYLDTLRLTSEPFRMSAPSTTDVALGTVKAASANGNVLTAGLRMTVPVRVNDSRTFELRTALADPATGKSATATAGPLRFPPGGGDLIASISGLAANEVLANAAKPVLFYHVADSSGLVVHGGRVDLPGVPEPGFTREPADLVAGDNATFRDTSGFSTATGSLIRWYFHDGTSASGSQATRNYPAAGAFDVRLRVTNPLGVEREITKPISVAMDLPPILQEAATWKLTELERSEFTPKVVDPNRRSITLRVLDGPDGMNATGATLSWTPPLDAPRTLAIRVAASDGRQESEFRISLQIANADTPPRLESLGEPLPTNLDLSALDPWELRVLGVDDENDAVTVKILQAPEGVTLVAGILAWPLPEPGEHDIVLAAEANGRQTNHTLKLVVTADAPTVPTEPPEATAPPSDDRARVPAPAALAALAALGAAALVSRRRA